MAITAEMFEAACGGSVRAPQVTAEMLELAGTILKSEAKRLNMTPASEWYLEPTISEIEDAGIARDREIQAVLTVAQRYGEDDFGIRVDPY